MYSFENSSKSVASLIPCCHVNRVCWARSMNRRHATSSSSCFLVICSIVGSCHQKLYGPYNPHCVSRSNYSPLHRLWISIFYTFQELILPFVLIVKPLVDVHIKTNNGYSALYYAHLTGNSDIAKMRLSINVDHITS